MLIYEIFARCIFKYSALECKLCLRHNFESVWVVLMIYYVGEEDAYGGACTILMLS